MSEKKELRVRFSTIVLVFLVIILVVALGWVYYAGFIKNKNNDNIQKNDVKVVESKNEVAKNDEDNSNVCYTDGNYYYLMLYKTNLDVHDSKTGPASEQRTFCLLVNYGYGQDYLYGSYYIENNKIILQPSDQYDYNFVNNVANMMVKEKNIEIKKDSSQYSITLDYTKDSIKYGTLDLKNAAQQSNSAEINDESTNTNQNTANESSQTNSNQKQYPNAQGAIFTYDINNINEVVSNKEESITYIGSILKSNPYKISEDRKSITIDGKTLKFETTIYHACVYPVGDGGAEMWTVLLDDGNVKYTTDRGVTIKDGGTHIVDVFPIEYEIKTGDKERPVLRGGTILIVNEFGGMKDLRV